MSLAFVDDSAALAARSTIVELGVSGDKAQLLSALADALGLGDVDNLDAFYDRLTDATGAIAVLSACAWWRAEPLLLAQVSQCFLDVGDRVALTWVMD